jgi:hypothetical protein
MGDAQMDTNSTTEILGDTPAEKLFALSDLDLDAASGGITKTVDAANCLWRAALGNTLRPPL